MYNPKFTSQPFDGNLDVKRGHKLMTDAEGKALGTLSKKHICDLNGSEIATYERTEKSKTPDGKTQKSIFYKSGMGEMKLTDGLVFLNGTPVGKVPARDRNPLQIIILAIASLFLLSAVVLVALIDLPYVDIPKIEVKDSKGTWEAQGTIAVLDSSIAPGSSGEYKFILENPQNANIIYDFKIKEIYNGQEVTDFPMEFRMKMNNVLLSEDWVSAEQLTFTDLELVRDAKVTFTLEWRWSFEGANNEIDTYFGKDNGEYSLEFIMTAINLEEG